RKAWWCAPRGPAQYPQPGLVRSHTGSLRSPPGQPDRQLFLSGAEGTTMAGPFPPGSFSVFRTLLPVLLFALLPTALAAVDGPTAPAASGTLQPGEFLWHPEIAPRGPIVVVVSLDEQRAYVYRNGLAIGVSTVSSGKPGKDTPTGVFTILQKNRDHRSNLYNNAPMPYMQRLTWDGIALHGGALPGHPASQGCVRLPLGFARLLFAETRNG